MTFSVPKIKRRYDVAKLPTCLGRVRALVYVAKLVRMDADAKLANRTVRMVENKAGRGRGRPPLNSVAAMTAAERMRKSRALKRGLAAQPSRPGNPGYTPQYSYYKRQTLMNFAKFIQGSAGDSSVTKVAAEFELTDSEWRHLRSGKRSRVFPQRYAQMIKKAEKFGWLRPRFFRIGSMAILSYCPRPLCSDREHRIEQSNEIKEMIEPGWDLDDLGCMNTSSISGTGLLATLAKSQEMWLGFMPQFCHSDKVTQ